jgi:hypothetical protein
MLNLRRATAAVLLAGAAMVPAPAAAPAQAVGSICAAPPADAFRWTLAGGPYATCADCELAGPVNPFNDPDWQCWPSTQPGAPPGSYDLYVLLQ